MPYGFSYVSTSADSTRDFGKILGRIAEPGLVVALCGQLGAGKTTFTRGVAEGAGIADVRLVTSPTFIVIQEYEARLPVYHFDTYRLRSPGEFAELGVEEYFDGDGICLVEWADRVTELLPRDRINVAFTQGGIDGESREMRVESLTERWDDLVKKWEAGLATLD